MNTLIRLLFNRSFIFLAGITVFLVANHYQQWVDLGSLWNGSPDGEQEEVVEQTDTPVPSTGNQKTPQTTTGQKPSAPTTVSGTSIVFPYTEALRDEPYYVEWWTGGGSLATLRLVSPEGESTTLPGCSSLSITPGQKRYCMWKPGNVDQLKSREGFKLELTVYTGAGAVAATAVTKTFTMVTTFTTPLVSYKDEMYGWSIRYPEGWTRTASKERVVIAKDKSASLNPLASDEALTIELCSLAREDCQSKKEAFLAAPSAREGSLGGKRTVMRVIAEGDVYHRRDLVERNGILYLTAARAVTPDGAIRSPYTRKAFAEFRFEPPKLSSETYELSRSSRSGSLTLEYIDARLTYARLSSIASGCETNLDTTTFKSANKDGFSIVRGMCTITGTKEGEDFTLAEDDCESIHERSCTFEGNYDFDS